MGAYKTCTTYRRIYTHAVGSPAPELQLIKKRTHKIKEYETAVHVAGFRRGIVLEAQDSFCGAIWMPL